jgi:glucosamine-phosphate N-acetyltransferase
MEIRNLQSDDYNKNYLDLLNQLSVINKDNISYNDFKLFIEELNKNHIIKVIELNNKIVASGTLYIENKMIHNLGKVGHIEDIIVDINIRGKSLGKQIVKHLIYLSENNGCYKTILNCNENNINFYEKCGLIQKEYQMVKYSHI